MTVQPEVHAAGLQSNMKLDYEQRKQEMTVCGVRANVQVQF